MSGVHLILYLNEEADKCISKNVLNHDEAVYDVKLTVCKFHMCRIPDIFGMFCNSNPAIILFFFVFFLLPWTCSIILI